MYLNVLFAHCVRMLWLQTPVLYHAGGPCIDVVLLQGSAEAEETQAV